MSKTCKREFWVTKEEDVLLEARCLLFRYLQLERSDDPKTYKTYLKTKGRLLKLLSVGIAGELTNKTSR